MIEIKTSTYFFIIKVMILSSLPHLMFAQSFSDSNTDSIQLEEVIISEQFFPRWYNYYENRDSAKLVGHVMDVGLLLSKTAPIYIRSYGRGMSYSLSVRGSNSAQVEVLWNGIPLNSPMQGQADLSLIRTNRNNSLLFDPNTYAFGLSGTLSIKQKNRRNNGIQFRIEENLSTTLGHDLNTDFAWKRDKLAINASFSALHDKNSFSYNFQNEKKEITNNTLEQYQGALSMDYQLNTKQALSIHFWGTRSNRQIPPSLYEKSSDASQDDQSLRLATHFKHIANSSAFNIRFALINDKLDYLSPIKNINSISEAARLIQQIDYAKSISLKSNFFLKIDHQYVRVNSNQYTYNPSYNDLFILMQSNFNFTKKDELSIGLKGGSRSFDRVDIAPYLYYRRSFSEDFRILIAAGRKFRYPSTNDLFWTQGGNENLRAEYAWESEIAFNYSLKPKLSLENRSYYKQVENWMQWLPINGVFTAQNIDLVSAYGMENSLIYKDNTGKLTFSASILHQWNITKYASGPNKDKQLIYKPVNIIKNNNSISWRNWNAILSQQYTGRVFTTTDQSISLAAYYLLNMHFGHSLNLEKGKFDMQAGVVNIFNTSFFTIENYVMPGRIFELGIAYQYN